VALTKEICVTHATRDSRRFRIAAATAVATVCLSAAVGGPAIAVAAPRANPTSEVTADATADAQAALLAKEARSVGEAYNLTVLRVATVTPGRRGTGHASDRMITYDIHAVATRRFGREVAYEKVWTCQRSWITPNRCSNFRDRRDEFFAAALAKHREARAQLMSEFDAGYLSMKNELDVYRGRPFFLVNNLTTQREGEGRVAGLSCLDVDGDPGSASESRVQLMGCQIDRATSVTSPTDQVWRFVPGSGRVQNVASGRCLDVAGPAADQVEHSDVVLSDCDATELPENADQQWGLNALGYLVNLSSGRCLDLTGAQATSNGVGATVAACQYGYSGALEGLGSSYVGLTESDRRTDQSWSMWYVDGGMDDFLPAPAPPMDAADVDTDPPVVIIGSVGQQPGGTTAIAEFSVDPSAETIECGVDGAVYERCASPHEIAALPTGSHQFSVRATDAAGNSASQAAAFTIDAEAPSTTILTGPSGTTTTVDEVTFTFGSPTAGSTFECSLDDNDMAPCSSPFRHGPLTVGTHTFKVRASGSNGVPDPSGAIRSWTVRKCLLTILGRPCLLRSAGRPPSFDLRSSGT
jgi:hypothetical protein